MTPADALQALAVAIGQRLNDKLPEGISFVFLLTDGTIVGYVANMAVEDALAEMRQFLELNDTASTGKATDVGDERRN